MPIRVMFAGVTFETDTAEEALALAAKAKDIVAPSAKSRNRRGRAKRASITEVFANGYKPALDLLLQGPADSAALAKAIGKEPRSLPPILRAWKARARKAGRELDEFLTVGRSSDSRTTIYSLTEEGRSVFGESQV